MLPYSKYINNKKQEPLGSILLVRDLHCGYLYHMPDYLVPHIMNDKDKEHIKIMRLSGYSYGEIANTLSMPRATISSHCLRNSIFPMESMLKKRRHSICEECGELFLRKTNRQQRFCSNKCRNDYWKKDRTYKASLEAEAKQYQTLQKELDFLAKKSDELDDREGIPLCRRKEEI